MLAINNKENLVKGLGAILFALGFLFLSSVSTLAQTAEYDYDGDGKTDIATYGFNDSEWWHLRSSDNGNGAVKFGNPEIFDMPVPADYTGDGITDAAFWRVTTGEWFILRSEDNSFYSFPFGNGGEGDQPIVGDYDGDGKADAAVYRRDDGMWYIQQSTDGFKAVPFGTQEDIPVHVFRYAT